MPAPRQYLRSRTPPGRDHQAPVTPPKATAPVTPPKAHPKGKAKSKPKAKAQQQRRSQSNFLQETTQQRPSTSEIRSTDPNSEYVYARVPFNCIHLGWDRYKELLKTSNELGTRLKFRDGNRRVGPQGDHNRVQYDGRVTIFGPEARHIWNEFLKLAKENLPQDILDRFDQIKADLMHGFEEDEMAGTTGGPGDTPGNTPRGEAQSQAAGSGEASQQVTATSAHNDAINEMDVDYDPDTDTDLPAGTQPKEADRGLDLYELNAGAEAAIGDDTPRAEASAGEVETSQQAVKVEEGGASLPRAEEGGASQQAAAEEGGASQQTAAEEGGASQPAVEGNDPSDPPPPPPPQAAKASGIPPPPPALPATEASGRPLSPQQAPPGHFDWYSDIVAKARGTSASGADKASRVKPLNFARAKDLPPLQRRRVPVVTLRTQDGCMQCL